MKLVHLSVDDFYPAPLAVQAVAKSLQYGPQEYEGHTYNGVGTGFQPEGVEKILGEVFGGIPVTIPMQFFRLGTKETQPTSFIHADNAIAAWAAVWYLTEPPVGVTTGTAFWRHKEFGVDCIPNLMWVREKFKDKDDPVKYFLDTVRADGEDESKWDMVGLIGHKMNRCAIYPGHLFHSRYPRDAWGADVSDGRLTWAAFFNRNF